MKARALLLASLLVGVACQGPRGPAGSEGPGGPSGPSGDDGDAGVVGSASCFVPAGETLGLSADVKLSSPSNGQYFVAGEQPTVTVRFSDRCNDTLPPSSLLTAQIYLAGPRGALTEKTALKLLNAVSNRAASDRQHHFVSLKAPSFLDPSQN